MKTLYVAIEHFYQQKNGRGTMEHCLHHPSLTSYHDNPRYEHCANFAHGNYRISIYIKRSLAFRPSVNMLKTIAEEYLATAMAYEDWEFS